MIGGAPRVLVTGATGFIGRHLVARLAGDGEDVLAVHARPLGDRALPDGGTGEGHVVYRQADLRDGSALAALFEEIPIHAVFHVAAAGVAADLERDAALTQVNVGATAALGLLAARAGVASFVHLGSAFEYRPEDVPLAEDVPLSPPNLYGASKAAGWLMLDVLRRTEGLALTTVRAFTTYGPGEGGGKLVPHLVGHALRRESVDLTSGTQVRDFLYIDDLVDALVRARGREGEVYNIGGGPGAATTVRAFAERVFALAGAPVDLCRFGALRRTRPDPSMLVADTAKARRDLGWVARVPHEEGLRRTIASWRP